MISHEHKCIFIHISKCAGSSIESAFGIDISDNTENNNSNLFGWNKRNQFFLQHATPQELIDGRFLSIEIWNTYYKFIIVRNPYSRALSDYLWMMKDLNVKDSFSNFLSMSGNFEIMKDTSNIGNYRADHLKTQKDYFFLNGKEITYDFVLRFETLFQHLGDLTQRLKLPSNFFKKKINTSKKEFKHYSHFYSMEDIDLVEKIYGEDLDFLSYNFEDRRNILFKLRNWIC
jgi:hypothetical protein